MDFSARGGKTGTGGVASESEANRDRRERLRQLALETIDLAKDPYFMKNHLGKKHQYNLQRRAHEQSKEGPGTMQPEKARVEPKKFIKIGRPGYKVTKQKCQDTGQQSMLFQIDFPEIADANGIVPRHRFMSAYEQRIEPPDRKWQYLLFAAEPYETIAFKIPSREIDKNPTKLWTFWNPITKQFFLQFAFKLDGQSSSIAMLRDLELQKARAQQAQMQLHLPPPPPPPPNNIVQAVENGEAKPAPANGVLAPASEPAPIVGAPAAVAPLSITSIPPPPPPPVVVSTTPANPGVVTPAPGINQILVPPPPVINDAVGGGTVVGPGVVPLPPPLTNGIPPANPPLQMPPPPPPPLY